MDTQLRRLERALACGDESAAIPYYHYMARRTETQVEPTLWSYELGAITPHWDANKPVHEIVRTRLWDRQRTYDDGNGLNSVLLRTYYSCDICGSPLKNGTCPAYRTGRPGSWHWEYHMACERGTQMKANRLKEARKWHVS